MSDTQNNWHNLSQKATFEILETSEKGLNTEQADSRLCDYGENRLPEPPKKNLLIRFLSHFHNILIYVLLVAAVITAALGHWIDTGVILIVVIVNAIIGFIQEGKAEKALDAIRQLLSPHAAVMRNGERISVEGEKLVPGDIVMIEAGDKVPADLRLFSAHGFSIQEAILTGESVPVEKNTKAVELDIPLGDRTCMAFSGTLVTSGQAKGIVVATGSQTQIGRISGLLSDVQTLTTPLVSQMAVFAKWLTVAILFLSAILLGFGYFVEHYTFSETFMAVVGLAVAAIPEGLPAVLTITLAIGVQAMAKRHAIVRRLPAIETLGSVSVICSDKTGTLTRNEMMVASVLTSEALFTVDGEGYTPEGEIKQNGKTIRPEANKALQAMSQSANLCNDAALRQKSGYWSVEGDPMEGALLTFARKVNKDAITEQSTWQRLDAIPFDAKHRYMATLNHNETSDQTIIIVKGAPEQVLNMCHQQYYSDQTNAPLNKEYWNHEIETIAAQGQRVLGFAIKYVKNKNEPLSKSELTDSLIFLGLVGIIDPPRTEAITAISECHQAGIRVKMITGDHAKTAAAIGKQVGLQNSDMVLTGADLDQMDDETLKQVVTECDIFARTSPKHKLRLVMALQSHRMTVAMTGDGVNDAPALKRADAGIAMGQKGSEAAKEAAELVLTDDNFASIVAAVRAGRTVYDNLTKVIAFILPINGGEAISLILALLIGLTLPISPTQILWINMIGSAILAITLAFEPPEPEVMKRPPRCISAPLLSPFVIWRILFVSILFAIGIFGQFQLALAMGNDLETARTIVVNAIIAMEVFYLFSIRYGFGTSLTLRGMLGTPPVIIALVVIILAQLAMIYLPFMQQIFNTRALGVVDYLLIMTTGIILFLLIELEKKVRVYFLTVP